MAVASINELARHHDGCATGAEIWNQTDFFEIRSIIGHERAETLLRSYILFLGKISASLQDQTLEARQLREAAHDLKSMSGQLGFEALHRFCDAGLAAGLSPAVERRLLELIAASSSAAQFYCRTQRAAA